MSLRGKVERVCREWGVSEEYQPDGIHRWRCEHVDRYGPCTCFAEFITDLMGVIESPVQPEPHRHTYARTAHSSHDEIPVGSPCIGCGQGYPGRTGGKDG